MLSLKNAWVYDLETYPNYFLAIFKNTETAEYKVFTYNDVKDLIGFITDSTLTLIGYNNSGFDDIHLMTLIEGTVKSTEDICKNSGIIIGNNYPIDHPKHQQLTPELKAAKNKVRSGKTPWRCIDIQEILGGHKSAGSLKANQVKYGWHRLQELPIKPNTLLADEMIKVMVPYCQNDVDSTEFLFNITRINQSIEARYKFEELYPISEKLAGFSKDATLAEIVFRSMLPETKGLTSYQARDFVKLKENDTFYFFGEQHILKNISFKNAHNMAVLNSMRACSFNTENETALDDFTIVLPNSGSVYDIGKGGLHSSFPPMVIEGNLINADVSSYYPELISNVGRFPKGLSQSWLDLYRELTAIRIKAKNEGDTIYATVLKIVINSVYGKLRSKYSVHYDPTLLLEVTINGQLSLLMLLEALDLAGHQILSANTDGILIKTGDAGEENVNQIIDAWTKNVNLSMDVQHYDKFVSQNVNNYALIKDNKIVERKGVFKEKQKSTPAVIENALLEHICTGVNISDYVRSRTNILDFILTQKVNQDYDVKWRGEEVQNVNRWYKSANGEIIEKWKHGKVGKVANSDFAMLCNDLDNFDIPADIDYDYYIAEADKKLLQLQNGLDTLDDHYSLMKSVEDLRLKGLVVVPKGTINVPKQNIRQTFTAETISKWRAGLPHKSEWLGYNGCGVYSGKDFGIIGIDIDYPDIALASGLFDNIKKSSSPLIAHHNTSKSGVMKGESKGTLLFKYSGDLLHNTDHNFLKNNGFELLYGSKIIQMKGVHESGDRYTYSGTLCDIPEKLLNWLTFIAPEHSVDEVIPDDVLVQGILKAKHIINSDLEYIKIKGHVDELINNRNNVILQGICPSCGDKTLRLYWHTWGISGSCFHKESCGDAVDDWKKAINKKINPPGLTLKTVLKTKEVKPEVIVPKQLSVLDDYVGDVSPDLHNACAGDEKFKIVLAQPGSGKSTIIMKTLIERVRDRKKVFVVVQSKDQMAQMGSALLKALGTSEFKSLGIVFLEASASMSLGDDSSSNSIPAGTLAVVTHFTYAGRWGESPYLYEAMRFVDSNTWVLIDEVDAYIDSLMMTYDFGARAKITGNASHKIQGCLVSRTNGNCKNCVAKHYDSVDYDIGSYGVPEFMQHKTFKGSMRYDSVDQYNYAQLNPVVGEAIKIGCNEIITLRQTPEHLVNTQLFHDKDSYKTINRTDTLRDMFTSAYLPTLHRPFIRDSEDNEVSTDDMRALIKEVEDGDTKTRFTEMGYFFPQRPCNVLTFAGINRKPFLIYRGTEKVIGFSATIANVHINFIKEMLPDVAIVKVPVAEERKLKKLIFVGVEKGTSVTDILKGDLKSGGDTVLKFYPTAAKASFNRALMVEAGVNADLFTNKLSRTIVADDSRIIDLDINFVVSYALSSIGRGMNLPEFKIAWADMASHKPTCAYSTDDLKTLMVEMFDQQLSTVIQNIGRIFRTEGPEDGGIRVVVVENLNTISSDVRKEFAVDSFILHAYLSNAFEESFEEFEEWFIPSFVSDGYMLEGLSYVMTNKALPAERISSWEDCIAEVRKNGANNNPKLIGNLLKKVPKYFRNDLIQAQEAFRFNSKAGNTNNKGKTKDSNKVLLDGKKRKIDELMAKGNTMGRIKADIGYKQLDEAVREGIDKYMKNSL